MALSAASLLSQGLALPAPLATLRPIPPGHACPLTGEFLTKGYAATDIIPDTTGNIPDLLGGDAHGFLSIAAATALKGDYNLGHRAFFALENGAVEALYPRLAAENDKARLAREAKDLEKAERRAAGTLHWKQEQGDARDDSLPRPLWRDLVRDIWPARQGQPCLLIVATDYKRRVWHKGRVGPLGARTPVLLFDPSRDVFKNAFLNWPHLLNVLTFVETVYAADFSKSAIERGLYAETRAMQAAGMAQARRWEGALSVLRSSDEFLFAVLIAQKPHQ